MRSTFSLLIHLDHVKNEITRLERPKPPTTIKHRPANVDNLSPPRRPAGAPQRRNILKIQAIIKSEAADW
jgi:hypothetical protein